MARRILSYSLLSMVIAWLVMSYLPASIFSPPQASVRQNSDWFGLASLTILVIMAAIQMGLLGATARLVRAYRDRSQRTDPASVAMFELKLSRELFWTIVPLLMVFALGLLSFSIWGAAWL